MRKELTNKDLQNIERHFANMGVADIETCNMTREEEEVYIRKNSFNEIRELGYSHIHTLRVVPLDGREPI
jgi:hypothetical protein